MAARAPTGGRLAVVTGASSGIGLAIARALAARGHDLLIAADEPGVEDAADALRAAGADVVTAEVDLATHPGVTALAARVEQQGQPVDALVLNAGTGVEGPFVETEVEDHLRVIGVNVTGTVHLAGLLLPAMVARGAGRVLVTSSITDVMAGPRMSTYNASKSFLSAWAEALAQDLAGTGVTVTTLLPGGTATRFFARTGMEDSVLARLPGDDADRVGAEALEALVAGRRQVVSGPFRNRVLRTAARALPDRLVGAVHTRIVRS